MKMKSAMAILYVAGGVLLITSCRKDPLNNLSQAETQIYVTNYDSAAKFSSYKTFAISDSVTVINNGRAFKEISPSDSVIVAAVKNNMQHAGYVQTAEAQNADLAVDVSKVFTTTGVIDYNDFWYYYGSYYDPAYWGYGGYPFYAPYFYNVYSITSGALSVDLLDLKNAPANKQINILWTGMARGEGVFDSTNASTEVNALFSQSPYLKIN